MSKGVIITEELDELAREGLKSIRASFNDGATSADLARAELALKVIRQGTGRMSGENNRMSMLLRCAKAAAVSPEEQRILWDRMMGNASTRVTAKTQGPLASDNEKT